MTIADREKISSLAGNLVFDFGCSLKNDDEFKAFIQAVDRLTHGCLSACKTLLTAKLLLKEKNEMEKSHD